ncbi:hypothetical protein LPJ68_003934 [Coemansia sp. RSA 1086]|nr:hypothetical protein LPJ68_003934 [Coemansia sp. RSA 1086]
MLLQFAVKLARTRPVLVARRKQLSLLFNRQYGSAIGGVSPELQKKIANDIRAYKGTAVSWFDMVTKYKLPQSQLEEIFAYDEAERLKRQELSAKVTHAAQQRYSNCRCDWEAVAQELDMPLLECLDLYDASQSSISPRSFPKLVDWPDEELQLLQQFVNKNFNSMTTKEWRLVEIYMNVKQVDCSGAYTLISSKPMSPEVADLISKYREAGLKWKDIHSRFTIYSTHDSLRASYKLFTRKPHSMPETGKKYIKWTEAQTDRVRELIQKHYMPGSVKPVADIVKAEFPEKTENQVIGKIRQIIYRAYIPYSERDDVKRLVDKYGEDWDRIAQELQITTKHVQRIWAEYQSHSKHTSVWTENELTLLRKCVHKGLDFATISGQLGTKSAPSCRYKWRSLQARDIDWIEVGQKLNRTVSACKNAYFSTARSNRLQSSADHTEVVSREVCEQYHKHKCVDWAQISAAVGLSQRVCLEANEFNEGKSHWEYDPDAFSQEMADRMTQFIKSNYPYPIPVNYQAVSNYMWIDKNDCYKMAKLLDGEIDWTRELKERVVALRR